MKSIQQVIECAGGVTSCARRLGVSVQAVCFWRDGKRRLPIEMGARLEEISGLSVRRWDLWPTTWNLIWPELIGTPGAPNVETSDAA